MARRRDYKAEYAARVARARAQGYTGYSQQRKARESAAVTIRQAPELAQIMVGRSARDQQTIKDVIARAILVAQATGEEARLPADLVERLRKMFPPESFYPLMRLLYSRRGGTK